MIDTGWIVTGNASPNQAWGDLHGYHCTLHADKGCWTIVVHDPVYKDGEEYSATLKGEGSPFDGDGNSPGQWNEDFAKRFMHDQFIGLLVEEGLLP